MVYNFRKKRYDINLERPVRPMAGHERRKPMKFSDMPYERVDFEKVGQELSGLIRELGEAKNGEEQFAVHQRYYALT